VNPTHSIDRVFTGFRSEALAPKIQLCRINKEDTSLAPKGQDSNVSHYTERVRFDRRSGEITLGVLQPNRA
jgi:hypothetical protein